MAKPPARRSSSQEIQRFLQQNKTIATFVERQPRLLFAIDATASRQPTWNSAMHLQQEMFRATHEIGPLAVQLVYFRGFLEFSASRWLTDAEQLALQMSQVHCEGGHTQIRRVLDHALAEHRETSIRAVVFIGDAVEESSDKLCELAGQCGILKLPLFLFQEGGIPEVERTFRSLAKLSGGAYARFDTQSASALATLLGAVARYAAGGIKALQDSKSKSAKLLLQQLNR
mgnify:FL=1